MRRLLRDRLRRKVIVTCKDGATFSGVLYAADADVVVLRHAEAHDPNPRAGAMPVDGEILIFRSDVSFVQIP